MGQAKILVVDDEDTLREVLKFNLEISGYDVDVATNAEEALTKTPLSQYDLVILDVMMGQMSGFAFARILKADNNTKSIPIIFLTAKDNEDDMVAGLNIGADDYIYKPFTIRNVIARVQSVLRRTMSQETIERRKSANAQIEKENKDIIKIDNMVINTAFKTVTIDGENIRMPRKEYEILLMLVTNPGRMFTRHEILARVWGEDVVVVERVVDVNITRLRKKIGAMGDKIMTRSGYGYGFEL